MNFSRNLKTVIKYILFIVLLTLMFSSITYIFRSDNAESKLRMVGLKEEENLDVIYIGSSSVYLYWEPLRAYNDAGFTSYNYATSALPAEAYEYYIKESLRYQNPELFIIDCRSFVDWDAGFGEVALRFGADGMTWYSGNRIQYITKYLKYHELNDNKDALSYYFDIAKYHENYDELGNRNNWEYVDDKIDNHNKGYYWMDGYDCLLEPAPEVQNCDDVKPIEDTSLILLNELLDFCDAKRLKVLFVVDPYMVTYDDMARYNYIKDVVTLRGYDFLNTNSLYDEMKLDYSFDMMNSTHVNCSGAAKFTDFMVDYLKQNYNLPDHRSEEKYYSWNEDYKQFKQEEDAHMGILKGMWDDYEKSYVMEEVVKNEADDLIFNELIHDKRYYVFRITPDKVTLTNNDRALLDTDDLSNPIDGTINRSLKNSIEYSITADEAITSIVVNDEVINCENGTRYTIVVDVNLARVIDIRQAD